MDIEVETKRVMNVLDRLDNDTAWNVVTKAILRRFVEEMPKQDAMLIAGVSQILLARKERPK